MSKNILLVDNEDDDLYLWKAIVQNFGYHIETAKSGPEALELLDELKPALVLLDLNMPGMSGIETCQHIKAMPRHMNLPVIMLTSSDDLSDKLNSFEQGADDYITKEMEEAEIEKRIETVIRRYRQNLDSNPLTHLPGNYIIQDAIRQKLGSGLPFTVGYCDLDNFKAYNDKYGFVEGDRLIRFCAALMQQALKEKGSGDDFLGHIGGDDFVFLSTPDRAEAICKEIIERLEADIGTFYNEEDLGNGYIISKNRQGRTQKFSFVSISIALVSNQRKTISSLAEVAEIAGELKKLAKKQDGNAYVFDKRIR